MDTTYRDNIAFNLLKLAQSCTPRCVEDLYPCSSSLQMIYPDVSQCTPLDSLICDQNSFVPKHVEVDETDNEDQEPDPPKSSSTGRKRSTRNISLLCLQLSSELQRKDATADNKTRDALALATGFARQRICTVVSVYKAIGLITENKLRKGVLEWNQQQSVVMPHLPKYIEHYRETRKLLHYVKNKEIDLIRKMITYSRLIRKSKDETVVHPIPALSGQRSFPQETPLNFTPSQNSLFAAPDLISETQTECSATDQDSQSSTNPTPPEVLKKAKTTNETESFVPQVFVSETPKLGVFAKSKFYQKHMKVLVNPSQFNASSTLISNVLMTALPSLMEESSTTLCYSDGQPCKLKLLAEQQEITQSYNRKQVFN
ncbi:hypothetical protein GEMRC1_001610 [Eukaryota sp. GEM-RC1]